MSQCLIVMPEDAHKVFLKHPVISINDRRTRHADTPAWYGVTNQAAGMSQLDLGYLLDLLSLKKKKCL